MGELWDVYCGDFWNKNDLVITAQHCGAFWNGIDTGIHKTGNEEIELIEIHILHAITEIHCVLPEIIQVTNTPNPLHVKLKAIKC